VEQYYINKVPNKDGFNVLHIKGCFRCFFASHKICLGAFETCEEAVIEAHKYFKKVLACSFCLPNCFPDKEKPYKPSKELFE
jgi:hypothetical protein